MGVARAWVALRHVASRRPSPFALLLLALSSTGCGALLGILGAVAAAGIADAIKGGGGGHHHKSTVLVVVNDAASLDAIVGVDVAPVTGTETPSSHVVGVNPGLAATFTDVFETGPHWVRVTFAGGWRSRPRVVDILSGTSVVVTFLHPAADLAPVAGAWFGATQKAGVGHTYSFTLDTGGDASGRTLDGLASVATGTLEETSEGVYRLTWSDGRVDALIADALPTATYVAVVSDDHTNGILQKGATPPLPVAGNGDVVGNWTGVQVRFSGATLDPIDVDAASATVDGSNNWTGREGIGNDATSTSPLVVSDAPFLRFFTQAVSGGLDLDVAVGLSPNRQAQIAAITPSAGGTFPDDTVFQLLTKGP